MGAYFAPSATSKNRYLAPIAWGSALYVITMAALFISSLPRLRQLAIGKATDVAIGPFTLVHIEKTVLHSGFSVAIGWRPGLVLLFAACLTGAFAWAKLSRSVRRQ